MGLAAERFEFDTAGLRLVGERWVGGREGDVVVLLHGGGQTRHSWARTGERVAALGWNAVSLDARGHGESAWDPQGDYTLEAFAGDVRALAAILAAPPVLVGASLGGIAALLAEGEQPGLARALVLVDVVVAVEPEGVRRIRAFMSANNDGFGSLEEVADAIAAYNPVRRRPRNLEGLRKNVRLGADGRWHWHWDPAFMRIDEEPRRLVDPGRLRDAAARVQIPTLLVRGAHSDLVSDAGVADMRRLIPTAEFVEVRDAGHMVAGDDNDVFASRLEDFLSRLADAPRRHGDAPR